MTELKTQACEACRADAPHVTEDELTRFLEELPQWKVMERNGERQIERIFKCRNFAEALAFTCRVGELAESENHHPAITTEYGKVTVTWWTHKIGGLHRNDFVMAARTDALYF